MEESVQKFVDFIYFLIDIIRDLVLSVSGKAKKPDQKKNAAVGCSFFYN